jgi:hypothetical protein
MNFVPASADKAAAPFFIRAGKRSIRRAPAGEFSGKNAGKLAFFGTEAYPAGKVQKRCHG